MSISAATMATQALPMEMRRPARMAGAAAGRITWKKRRGHDSWSRRATCR
jgi:hypothetical protein